MRAFGYINHTSNKYRLYIRSEYKGSFETLEEAERARESFKETYEPVELSPLIPLFAERLNVAIGRSNKSIVDISKQAGLARSNIAKYLNGATPSVNCLVKLALTLNVSTDWLLGLKNT